MKVPPKHHITIQAVLYSVPYTVRGHVVEVKITDHDVTVFANAEIVAYHGRSTPRSKITVRRICIQIIASIYRAKAETQ